jgi:prevent-host-death family protein
VTESMLYSIGVVFDLVHDLVYNYTMIVNIHEAKTQLSKLIVKVASGEEIIIAKSGNPVARLIRYTEKKSVRKPGSAKGLITIHDDFDDPLPEEILRDFEL